MNRVQYMMTQLQRRLPEAGEESVHELAQFAAETYLKQAMFHSPRAIPDKSGQTKNIQMWRGRLFNTLLQQRMNPRKKSRYTRELFIPSYAVKLDRQKPHFVALKRGRLITQWASEKLGKKRGSVMVAAHPFINKANRIIGQNVNRIVSKKVHKKVRGSKK